MTNLEGRTLFIPEMDYGGARVLAAAFRNSGVNSRVVPPSSQKSCSLAGKFTSGDECYPTKITLGDFLDILDKGVVKPSEAAFFMASASGPCRFGQYRDFFRNTLDEIGYKDVPVFSFTSEDSYGGLSRNFEITAWRGIVASDILRKFLYMIRPYEVVHGETDKVFEEYVEKLCSILANKEFKGKDQKNRIIEILKEARDKFNKIETKNKGSYPLIAFVGEIFCRLNTFSNEDLIRKFEQQGAEGWLVGVAEWIYYTNADEIRRLKELNKRFSKKYIKAVIKRFILRREEHEILKHFSKDLCGREECDVDTLLKYSLKYLPWYGSLGEMTLSVAGAIYYQKKGCSGVVNISSFACMNEIVSESVYPRVSKDLGNFPIKVFYFDGTASNLDRDIGIFLELARNYKPNIN